MATLPDLTPMALKPGLELDLMVAERVLGWTIGDHAFGHDLPGGPWQAKAVDSKGYHSMGIPAFSTEIGYAWMVVNKLSETWDTININYDCGHWFINLEYDPGHGQISTSARMTVGRESAPHAICVAALMTLGAQEWPELPNTES